MAGSPGDKAAAAGPATGIIGPRQVTQLHINTDRDLTNVTVRNANTGKTSTLKTTANHPFWDATDRQWVDAAMLKVGHRLLVHDEKRLEGDNSGAGSGGGGPPAEVTVVKVHNFTGTQTMRDLTVADLDTYYVIAGKTPVLVHNNNGCGDRDLIDAVDAEYAKITTKGGPDYLSIKQRGPVLTGVKDRLTGDIVTSLNHGTAIDNLHPSLAARLGGRDLASHYPGGSGVHGETHGLNELLWRREAAGLSTEIDDSFVFFSRRLRGSQQGQQISRCPACELITRGADEL